MSEMDDLIAGFRTSMQIVGTVAGGNEETDVDTPAGKIPSLAKQAKQAKARIDALLPDMAGLLRLDAETTYTATQKTNGRKNLGLGAVDNTADIDKPLSNPVRLAINELITEIQTREDRQQRGNRDGYPGYSGDWLELRNNSSEVLSYLFHNSTARRLWELPDKGGTLALRSDITGTNTGTNTGDETAATIKQKLGVSVLSGSNTGDFDSVLPVANVAAFPNQGVVKRLYIAADTLRMYYWNGELYQSLGASVSSTDSVPEGNTNKYFTQLRSVQAVLSNYLAGAQGVVDTSDTVANAVSKLQTQINQALSTITTALGAKENLINKATSFTTINHDLYPSVQAVKTYTDSLVVGVIRDCGNWDASNNTFPTAGGSGTDGAIKKGNFWYVSVAGKLGDVDVNVGDSFRALFDTPGQNAGNWAVLESNLGYVPYNATNPAGYISGITSGMVTAALGYTPYKPADKNAAGGIVGLTGYALDVMNTAGTIKSRLFGNASAVRTWQLPDKDGIVAMLSDLQGLSSGNNTGDETKETILQKLGASEVTGTNTGDQTITLTGDVAGSGTGTFTASIQPKTVTLEKMADIGSGRFLGRVSSNAGVVEVLTATQVKVALGLDQVDNTAVTNKESLANKAVDFSVIDNVKYATTLAIKNYMDGRLTSVVIDCGSWDASSGVYPSAGGSGTNGAIKKGNLFFISNGGVIGGVTLGVGDSIRALVDNPGQDNTKWDALETNIGYVPYNASNPAGYISAITSAMVTAALGYAPINPAAKNASGGVAGLTGYALNLMNATGTVTSKMVSNATASRTYTYPDKDGTVALLSDLDGVASAETKQSILSKLGATAVTGNNTGDETSDSIKAKLGVSTLSGSNTGDETAASIVSKLNYVPLNKAGDTLTGALNFKPTVSMASAATVNLSASGGNVVAITGTTDITSFTLADGEMRMVRFSGALKVGGAGNIVLPGGSPLNVGNGDWMILLGGSSVTCLHYVSNAGLTFNYGRDRVRFVDGSTASTTIDLTRSAAGASPDGATIFKVTISANTTITFTNPPPVNNGEIFSFTLITTNDGTAGRAMAFGNTIRWDNKTLPPRTTAANAVDVWSFYYDAGNYNGSLAIENQG